MLSSKARYGLLAMAALARHHGEKRHVAGEEIAQENLIPEKFLEAILTQLCKRGLLTSKRGPSGGYMLAREPKLISLAEVIRTLDGPFAPTPCARTSNPVCCEGCVDMKSCQVRPFMREVRDVMAAVWEKRTVWDLASAHINEKKTRQKVKK